MQRILTLAIILTLAAALAAACGGDDDDGGGDSGDFSNEVVRERDGVVLSIASDKASYAEGEEILLRATLTNGTEGSIAYGSVAQPGATQGIPISINTALAGAQILPDEDPEAPTGGTLMPQGSEESNTSWDRELATYQTPVTAPMGTYTATASAIITLPGSAGPVEVTAAVEFTLETGAPVAAADVVIQAAVAQQEVQDWFEGRQTNVICAYGGRLIFYNVDVTTGALAETFESLYDAAIANGDPICSPVTEGDMWRVIFSDFEGDAPNKVSAMLELETADFIRLEEGGPTAAPETPSQ